MMTETIGHSIALIQMTCQIFSFYKFQAHLLKIDHPKEKGKLVEQIKYQMHIIFIGHLITYSKINDHFKTLSDISIWCNSAAQK